MHSLIKASLGAALAFTLASPALAQGDSGQVDWTGPYVGGGGGYAWQGKGKDETIRFDTDRDGNFDNTVTTATGANAFTPGFCGGAARGNAPAAGCTNDHGGTAWSVHAGYDRQFGSIVAGIVAEGGDAAIVDNVSAFSTTPASYTMTRSLGFNAGIRARLGFTTKSGTLLYATGGGVYGKIRNSFSTTNNFNTFTETGRKDNAWGWTAGGGVDQKIGDHFSIGVLYKYTRFNADGYGVNAGQGTPPSATNPFVITSAGSTDFARESRFDTHSVMATASYRF